MPIDGLVSGIDSASIISQLMELERQPIVALTSRVTKAQAAVDAYASIRANLSTLTTAANELSRATAWGARTATSSDPAAAAVTAASNAPTGTLSFTVDQVATRHGIVTATGTPTRASVIASAGSIDLTIDGTTHTINVGSGTFDEVLAAINNADVGVSAAAVNTGSGFRLQMNATASGAASEFTIDSGLDIATAITSQAQDAQLTVGSGPGAYTVTSASNVFANTFDGLTVTAKVASSQPVTITVATDSAAIADKVETLITALNSALSEIKARSAYDSKTGASASLTGDREIRRVAQDLTSALIGSVPGSTLGSAGLAGVALDRYGAVSFDRAAFTAAHEANPSAVKNLFSNSGVSTGNASFVLAGATTVSGDHEVVVTQAAKQATKLGMVGSFVITSPITIVVKVGNISIAYSTSMGDTQAETVDGLQAAIDAEGLGLTVASDGSGLSITSEAYGSSASFEVAFDGTTFETATGEDVQGTIGGQLATGNGHTLTSPAGSGDSSGLVVSMDPGFVGNAGIMSYSAGIAQRLASVVTAATDSTSGYVTGAEDSRKNRISLFNDSISRYETRLIQREARLRKQYADLEVALGSLQSMGTFVTSQLSSLNSSSS